MIYSSGTASQSTPSRIGVIVYVSTNGPEVSFTNISDGISLDVPLDCDKPIRFPVGSFADQLKLTPLTELVNVTAVVGSPVKIT